MKHRCMKNIFCFRKAKYEIRLPFMNLPILRNFISSLYRCEKHYQQNKEKYSNYFVVEIE